MILPQCDAPSESVAHTNDAEAADSIDDRGLATSRQSKEVPAAFNRAVLEYLSTYYPATMGVFAQEAGLTTVNASGVRKGILLSKWGATARLSLRVSELEKEVKELQQKLHIYDEMAKVKTGCEGFPSAPALNVLQGHRSAITAVVFHPVFLLGFTASEDATIRVWELESEHGSLERTLRDHTDAVNALDFDATGRWLASASSDTSIKIWDVTKMECIRTLHGHSDAVSSAAYSKVQKSMLVSGSRDHDIKLWDTSTGDCLKTFSNHDEWVKGVAFCPQIPSIFSACSADHTISTWCISECKNERRASIDRNSFSLLRRSSSMMQSESLVATLEGHEHVVSTICFATSAALQCLIDAGRAPPRVFDDPNVSTLVSSLRVAWRKSDTRGSASVTGSPPSEDGDEDIIDQITEKCGPVVFSGSRDSSIKMWDAVRGNCILTFVGHANWVNAIQCHASGEYILSGSDDCCIRMWSLADGSCCSVIPRAHQGFITCLAAHPTKNFVATGSVDMTLQIWTAHLDTQRSPSTPGTGTPQEESENEEDTPEPGMVEGTGSQVISRSHTGTSGTTLDEAQTSYAESIQGSLPGTSPSDFEALGDGTGAPLPSSRRGGAARKSPPSSPSGPPGASRTAAIHGAAVGSSKSKSPDKSGTSTRSPPKSAKAAPLQPPARTRNVNRRDSIRERMAASYTEGRSGGS